MTLLGFCLLEQGNVPIGPDRRCLVDSSLVLPPSTLCQHRRLVDGAWSACQPDGAAAKCGTQHEDTWRAPLSQQARALARRARDINKAAKAFRPSERQPQRMRDARPKPRKETPQKTCPVCTRAFTPRTQRAGIMQKTCSPRCGSTLLSLARRAQAPIEMIPCPVCHIPFEPIYTGHKKPKMNCSQKCAAAARKKKPAQSEVAA